MTDFTVFVNHDADFGFPYLSSIRWARRNGRMNSTQKHRLLDEYEAATQRLSQADERYGEVIGTPGVERDRVKRTADEARRICGETMAALQTHLLLYAC
jgi:hypothetical protein